MRSFVILIFLLLLASTVLGGSVENVIFKGDTLRDSLTLREIETDSCFLENIERLENKLLSKYDLMRGALRVELYFDSSSTIREPKVVLQTLNYPQSVKHVRRSVQNWRISTCPQNTAEGPFIVGYNIWFKGSKRKTIAASVTRNIAIAFSTIAFISSIVVFVRSRG